MRFICQICGYIYDEAKEGVPFDSLPDSWKCPLCGALKQNFEPEKQKEIAAEKPVLSVTDLDVKNLSAGQISAVCSNLARGCEKQYKPEEANLFQELAAYFNAITPPASDPNIESIAASLKADIDKYPGVRAVADEAGDRGAARVTVWGEKVTKMLASLINRYFNEGEAMLAETDIFVCSVCGFVYVGDEAPELCPVCKVPSWKFEKVERRA